MRPYGSRSSAKSDSRGTMNPNFTDLLRAQLPRSERHPLLAPLRDLVPVLVEAGDVGDAAAGQEQLAVAAARGVHGLRGRLDLELPRRQGEEELGVGVAVLESLEERQARLRHVERGHRVRVVGEETGVEESAGE